MIIDSHCHLHDPAFEDTRGAVTRATEHNVWGVVAVGCDPDTNRRTIEAAAANGKTVWPAFGFHPERAELTDEDLAVVESQVTVYHARLVALGEVGLPWYSLEGAPDAASLMAAGRPAFRAAPGPGAALRPAGDRPRAARRGRRWRCTRSRPRA